MTYQILLLFAGIINLPYLILTLLICWIAIICPFLLHSWGVTCLLVQYRLKIKNSLWLLLMVGFIKEYISKVIIDNINIFTRIPIIIISYLLVRVKSQAIKAKVPLFIILTILSLIREAMLFCIRLVLWVIWIFGTLIRRIRLSWIIWKFPFLLQELARMEILLFLH